MSLDRRQTLAQALEQCAREPVHIPGGIQDCGALLSVDAGFARIHQASANLGAFFDIEAGAAIGLAPEAVVGRRAVRLLRDSLARGDQRAVAYLRRRVGTTLRRLYIAASRSSHGRVLLEAEPFIHAGQTRLLGGLGEAIVPLVAEAEPGRVLQRLTEAVLAITGCDRVLVYQFDDDWHGVVRAESRVPGIDSFLHHHFPASDIPPQVRRLYEVSPVRSIPDATRPPVPLVPEHDPWIDAPLDMSAGMLRAVSPVHVEYMRNMGIVASMSVAVYREQSLWGLLSCHGRRPHAFSPALRQVARALVELAAQRLFWLEERADAAFLRRVEQSRETMTGQAVRREPGEVLRRDGGEWMRLFRACGLALVQGDTVWAVGRRPADREIVALARAIAAGHGRRAGCWTTDALAETDVARGLGIDGICGLLAAPMVMEEPESAWFMLFREEELKAIRWAGRPADLQMDAGASEPGPRRSFATWREDVRGRSARWREADVRAAQALAENLTVALSVSRIAQLNERLAHTNQRLRELAQTDSLTGLWNRYRMEQEIDEALATAERYARPFALLLFDVDHFKRVNDTWGHDVGDQVLIGLAGLARSLLRETDHLGRWGGEEFVLLAGDTGPEDAAVVAERLRREIAAASFPPAGQVTVSIGVASGQPGEPRRMLVKRADAALYQAKHEGRNRVMQAP